MAASETVSGLTPFDLSRGPGIDQGFGTTTYNSDQFTINGTLSDAITNGDYLEWGWSSSTTPFNLNDLDIRYDRSPTGPDELEIRLATNGSAFQTVFTDSSVDANGETNLDIDLSSFTNVTSATFRLFAFGATSGSGTLISKTSQVLPTAGLR